MPTAILILSSGLRRLGHKLGFFISVSKSVPSTCSRIWRFQQIIYVLSDLSVSSSKTADLSVSISNTADLSVASSNTADLSVATSNTTLPKKAKWQREHSPPRSLSWSRHRRRPGSERDVLREVFGNLSKATVLPPLCVSSPLGKDDFCETLLVLPDDVNEPSQSTSSHLLLLLPDEVRNPRHFYCHRLLCRCHVTLCCRSSSSKSSSSYFYLVHQMTKGSSQKFKS